MKLHRSCHKVWYVIFGFCFIIWGLTRIFSGLATSSTMTSYNSNLNPGKLPSHSHLSSYSVKRMNSKFDSVFALMSRVSKPSKSIRIKPPSLIHQSLHSSTRETQHGSPSWNQSSSSSLDRQVVTSRHHYPARTIISDVPPDLVNSKRPLSTETSLRIFEAQVEDTAFPQQYLIKVSARLPSDIHPYYLPSPFFNDWRFGVNLCGSDLEDIVLFVRIELGHRRVLVNDKRKHHNWSYKAYPLPKSIRLEQRKLTPSSIALAIQIDQSYGFRVFVENHQITSFRASADKLSRIRRLILHGNMEWSSSMMDIDASLFQPEPWHWWRESNSETAPSDLSSLEHTRRDEVDNLLPSSIKESALSMDHHLQFKSLKSHIASLVSAANPIKQLQTRILSAAPNRLHRWSIRRSWMKYPQFHPMQMSSDASLNQPSGNQTTQAKALFYISRSPNARLMQSIQEEAREFGDIVILPYAESYREVSFKTIQMLHHAAEFRARYFLKCDDDTYVHIPRLIHHLQVFNDEFNRKKAAQSAKGYRSEQRNTQNHSTSESSSASVSAPAIHAAQSIRQLHSLPNLYTGFIDRQPSFARGPGYVLSFNLARLLSRELRAGRLQAKSDKEDVNVGTWVRSITSSLSPHSSLVSTVSSSSFSNARHPHRLISRHQHVHDVQQPRSSSDTSSNRHPQEVSGHRLPLATSAVITLHEPRFSWCCCENNMFTGHYMEPDRLVRIFERDRLGVANICD